jgi:mono/diheme cytochrome c family protein
VTTGAPPSAGPVRAKWILVVFGPVLFMLIASALVTLYLPHPIPKTATPAQRLYLGNCASCHGANGHGSWRAWLYLLRPGDLGDAAAMRSRSDEYLFLVIKNGGATLGKPGMPAFGYHLKDEQIEELVRYLRALPRG